MTEPKWMPYARSLIGIKEVPGKGSNAKIMAWAKKLGAKILGITYASDDRVSGRRRVPRCDRPSPQPNASPVPAKRLVKPRRTSAMVRQRALRKVKA